MFGLTHYTPAATSLTALSAASLVGFGFNQFAGAELMEDSGHRRTPDNRFYDFDNLSDNSQSNTGLTHRKLVDSGIHLSQSSIGNNHANSRSGRFPMVLELSSLDGNDGFAINGISNDDGSGYSLSSAGDMNGDGYADIVIGAKWAKPHGKSDAGESYVVFGKSSGFSTIELSSLDGKNGFQINGNAEYDRLGHSVSGAGDVNGDGYADIILGAYGADPHGRSSAGESYVIFGKSSGFSTIELSSLDGKDGFQINGDGFPLSGWSGYSVSGAGDVNADGYADIVIGARYADPHGKRNAGENYVIFGKSSGFSTIELSSLDRKDGFQINGISEHDNSGRLVRGAGDVNGDGYADIVIGADLADPYGKSKAGESYVVFGKSSGFSTIELSSLDGVNGFQINGISQYDNSGYSVSGAGDVNADGYADVIIGAVYADPPDRGGAGESYVVFGKASGFSTIELSSLDGVNGFQINGISPGDQSGMSVSGVGDVNADGYADIIISAPYAEPHDKYRAGESYVVFGKSSGFGTVELSSLDGSDGFKLNGAVAVDWSGYCVSGAGDVNNDGFDDILIGALYADPNGEESGQSYVVFGKASLPSTPTLASNHLSLSKGERVRLTTHHLSASAEGAGADELVFNVHYTFKGGGSSNGQFEYADDAGNRIKQFTQADIESGRVSFVDDGTGVPPNYRVSVCHGDSTAPATLNFNFVDARRGEPSNTTFRACEGAVGEKGIRSETLTLVNRQIELINNKGEAYPISADELSATGGNVAEEDLVFTVSKTKPGSQDYKMGYFQYGKSPGKLVEQFTQGEINNGDIYFVNGRDNITPKYRVTVSDGVCTLPSYPSVDYYNSGGTLLQSGQKSGFAAMPSLDRNHLTIKQGERLEITTEHLSASAEGVSSEELVFNVHYTFQSGSSNGQFEYGDNEGVRIKQFSQSDIELGQVYYVDDGVGVPPDYRVNVCYGDVTAPVALNFNVVDARDKAEVGTTFFSEPALAEEQTRTDELTLVNHQIELVDNQGMKYPISSSELSATGGNVAEEDLLFTVTKSKTSTKDYKMGYFQRGEDSGELVEQFRQSEISGGDIYFVNGKKNIEPKYRVSVSEGLCTLPEYPSIKYRGAGGALLESGRKARSVEVGEDDVSSQMRQVGLFGVSSREARPMAQRSIANEVEMQEPVAAVAP